MSKLEFVAALVLITVGIGFMAEFFNTILKNIP